jgi:hypothetical protein
MEIDYNAQEIKVEGSIENAVRVVYFCCVYHTDRITHAFLTMTPLSLHVDAFPNIVPFVLLLLIGFRLILLVIEGQD